MKYKFFFAVTLIWHVSFYAMDLSHAYNATVPVAMQAKNTELDTTISRLQALTIEPVLSNTLDEQEKSKISWLSTYYRRNKGEQWCFFNAVAQNQSAKKIAFYDNEIIYVYTYDKAHAQVRESHYNLARKITEPPYLVFDAGGDHLAIVADGCCDVIDFASNIITNQYVTNNKTYHSSSEQYPVNSALFQDAMLLCFSNKELAVCSYGKKKNVFKFRSDTSYPAEENSSIMACHPRLSDYVYGFSALKTYIVAFVRNRLKNFLCALQSYYSTNFFIEFPANIKSVRFNKKADRAFVLLENKKVYIVSLSYENIKAGMPKRLCMVSINNDIAPITTQSNNPIVILKTLENSIQCLEEISV